MLTEDWPIPNTNLHEFDIGVILSAEQFDVRRVLLADSPTAPVPERRDSFYFRFSIFVFRFEEDLPWLH
ncbi:MAG: hypothetical protein DMG48_21255 [Acidobacteria bacterium]|nr:MAG: hypothetical protein DMG48_21255 [Acidobacteriota bacterium]